MNRTGVRGNLNEFKAKLKQTYATLTDDDLLYVEGKKEEFWAKLQKKTGETKDVIKRKIGDFDF